MKIQFVRAFSVLLKETSVQLDSRTGLVYRGPRIARDVNEGLLAYLARDGFDSIADAVGADLD